MITGTSFLELWYPFCYLASNSIHSISDCALVVMLTHVMLTIYLFAYTVAVVATYRCCICSKQWFSYRQRRLIGSDSGWRSLYCWPARRTGMHWHHNERHDVAGRIIAC